MIKEIQILKYANIILGTKMSVFRLNGVNYYTNGGEAAKYLNVEGEKISEKLKNDLLNNNVIVIFDD